MASEMLHKCSESEYIRTRTWMYRNLFRDRQSAIARVTPQSRGNTARHKQKLVQDVVVVGGGGRAPQLDVVVIVVVFFS